MRLYLKLFVLVAIFAAASRWQIAQTCTDLGYDIRAGFVCASGIASDYEALIDDTRHMLARERGNLDLYLKGKRYERLLGEYLAAAARLNIVLSEDDRGRAGSSEGSGSTAADA